MKKADLSLIAIGVLILVMLFRGEGRSGQVREVNRLIKQSEARQAAKLDSIRLILKERREIGRDCTIVIQRYEDLRSNPISDRVGDSLARAILRAKAPK